MRHGTWKVAISLSDRASSLLSSATKVRFPIYVVPLTGRGVSLVNLKNGNALYLCCLFPSMSHVESKKCQYRMFPVTYPYA